MIDEQADAIELEIICILNYFCEHENFYVNDSKLFFNWREVAAVMLIS